jgi:hypothetical protein
MNDDMVIIITRDIKEFNALLDSGLEFRIIDGEAENQLLHRPPNTTICKHIFLYSDKSINKKDEWGKIKSNATKIACKVAEFKTNILCVAKKEYSLSKQNPIVGIHLCDRSKNDYHKLHDEFNKICRIAYYSKQTNDPFHSDIEFNYNLLFGSKNDNDEIISVATKINELSNLVKLLKWRSEHYSPIQNMKLKLQPAAKKRKSGSQTPKKKK